MDSQIFGINLTTADFENMIRKIFKEEVTNSAYTKENVLDNNSENSSNYISTDDASKLCKVSKITLWNWACKGKISKTHIGRKVFYLRSEIEEILNQNTIKKVSRGV